MTTLKEILDNAVEKYGIVDVKLAVEEIYRNQELPKWLLP